MEVIPRNNPFDREKYPNCWDGHEYALDIISGLITANVWVISSCKRYIDDLRRIREDKEECPFYFRPEKAEKYLRIVQKFHHVKGKWETPEILYLPWQKFAFMNVMGFYSKETKERRFRTAHIDVARGGGKALCLETEIPTPSGLRRFGDLTVGDEVYARDGSVCKITGETPIHYPKAYEVTFDRDKKVIASSEHLWFVEDKNSRIRHKCVEKVLSTEEISKKVKVYNGREVNYSVRKNSPLKGFDRGIYVDPYTLGYWLGDGDKNTSRITGLESDLDEASAHFPYKISPKKYRDGSKGACITVYGLILDLDNLGLRGNKDIPSQYLSASIETRVSLIQGLLDSDGYIDHRGQIEFSTVRKSIAEKFCYLVNSVGEKATVKKKKIKSNFNSKNEFSYRVIFTPVSDIDFFRLGRKKSLQRRTKSSFTHKDNFYINEVTEIDRVPMKCISVDSKDNSFLCSQYFIPTHNSAMASQASLYFLCADEPIGNEVYCAASKKEQARLVLDSSRAMAKKNKSFCKRFGVEVLAHEIKHDASNSFAKALSSNSDSQDGLAAVLIVADELHAMSKSMFDVLDSGQSKRRDSLLLCITTAGTSTKHAGYSQRAYAQKVALGEVKDETFFSLVYRLDEADEANWQDEKLWIKANPGLYTVNDITNLRAKAKKAAASPPDKPNFLCKHLNLYQQGMNQFFNVTKWNACHDEELTIESLKGKKCYAAVDLSSKNDITSFSFVFRDSEGMLTVVNQNFCPEVAIEESDNDNYHTYVDEGSLTPTVGAAINYDILEEYLIKMSKFFKIEECFYDSWQANQFAIAMQKKGINMTEMRMNTSNLSEPTKYLEAQAGDGKVRHFGTEILSWMIGNVVCKEDAAQNVFPRKDHEDNKIDGAMTSIMATAGWINEDQEQSVYEERGIRIL
jgi:phage terminase large subunit-like protein